MDPVTHLALGSAIGVAALGRGTPAWKAAAWGALCGALPDVDVLANHGNPILDMTLHRSGTHSLVYLTLLSAFLAIAIASVTSQTARLARWWLATWLALLSHPLLDVLTVYGTRLGLPFSERAWFVGSVFIIDPLVTLPVLTGVVATLLRRDDAGRRWSIVGLTVSCGYLAWSYAAQQYVTTIARTALHVQKIEAERVLVVPTPFNTVLWRIVAVSPGAYHEGFHSLLDRDRAIRFDRFDRGGQLADALRADDNTARIAQFSGGFYALGEQDQRIFVRDLRMGQEPNYSFTFIVARRSGEALVAVPPIAVPVDRDADRALRWLWARLKGNPVPPPR